MAVGFKTPIQERAEREIFSKDKEAAKKAMEILLDEADRLIDAHCAVMPYQLLLASPAMMEEKLKSMAVMESKERKVYRMKCKWHGVLGGCHVKSKCKTAYFGIQWSTDILCTPDCGCERMKRFDKRKKD